MAIGLTLSCMLSPAAALTEADLARVNAAPAANVVLPPMRSDD
jgi:hypothetical protein